MTAEPGKVIELGHHLDGTGQPPRVGLQFYYPNGQIMARFGQLPDGTGRVGMEICDETGAVKVIAGEMADGQYGLAAVNPQTGETVDLAQLAFGMKGAEQGSSIQVVGRSDNNYDYVTDPTYPGPTVSNVLIGPAKRALVHLSGNIGYWSPGTDSRTGKMSFRVIDDVTGQETYPPMDGTALIYDSNGSSGTIFQAGTSILVPSWAFPVANRTYTFEARYQVRSFNSTKMYFQNRAMVVQPF
ncbi:hypothetical protein [Micromonospora sp. NPDC092111]|uniref:hypothetical protein n=1 Tax=Micromonospora sp. NPDC092111 TaxID=3364289 RepID=UPI0038308EA9